jgi:hypothetical protein
MKSRHQSKPSPDIAEPRNLTPPTAVASGTIEDPNALRPFHVNVPETDLTELRKRIKATKWPEKETVTDTSQGVQLFRSLRQ